MRVFKVIIINAVPCFHYDVIMCLFCNSNFDLIVLYKPISFCRFNATNDGERWDGRKTGYVTLIIVECRVLHETTDWQFFCQNKVSVSSKFYTRLAVNKSQTWIS